MPSLYVSHGAPPLFEDADWMSQLFAWARSIPRPRAILIASAHWESAPLALSSPRPGTPLVYDFAGFDPVYYRMRYPTPDASELAGLVAGLVPDGSGLARTNRGLDHGAWVPLMAMYPEADIPVLQLSLPTNDPAGLVGLGERLRPLREQGVLVIGSGFMTHGLPFVDWANPTSVPGWSRDFDAWAVDALARGDLDELSSFRERAPGHALRTPDGRALRPDLPHARGRRCGGRPRDHHRWLDVRTVAPLVPDGLKASGPKGPAPGGIKSEIPSQVVHVMK